MAIAKMTKVMVVTHRAEAAELLEQLQSAGVMQVLDAERAMVSKDWPELCVEAKRPKELEELISRLDKSITFLAEYGQKPSFGQMLAPRTVIDQPIYGQVVSSTEALDILNQSETVSADMANLQTDRENCLGHLDMLGPWQGLTASVEQLASTDRTSCFVGLIPGQNLEQIQEDLLQLNAAIDVVGKSNNQLGCVIVCLKENFKQTQKALRQVDFEQVSFEGMTGTVAELLNQTREKLSSINTRLSDLSTKAAELATKQLKIKILYDHYKNLLSREQTRSEACATEHTILLEGWVREKDYKRLEKTVSGFGASSVSRMQIAEGEEVPVEIDNNRAVKPFEVVTRLYGMPQYFELDPTALLAPFFALFFGLCLTDAGYGLVMILLIGLFIKKMQGDTKLMWMLIICAITTVGAGALTGGWFGDAVQQFVPALEPLRVKMIWFDPLQKPMMFFGLSLVLGYVQILAGLIIAFVHNLRRKDYIAAICDQMTWLVMLNSLVIFGFSKAGVFSAQAGKLFGLLAMVPAIMIVLFSERQGGWGGRLGMGLYQLFSTIFFMGDVLSYLRLMALGMVTAGLAMAVNVIAKIAGEIPYVGFIVGLIVLIGGHAFNLAISALSAFVHTLRLQFVEFFPKFLVGGGKLFEPLNRQYRHIYMNKK